jgi:calcium/calmodulin-dependent protein kinase kinase 2
MKAARKFRGLLTKKTPSLLNSIFGQNTRIVQPPLSMESVKTRPATHKAHSETIHDRTMVERALVREGIRHKIDPEAIDDSGFDRKQNVGGAGRPELRIDFHETQPVLHHPSPQRALFASPKDHRSEVSRITEEHHGKGHAHDPLDEFLFLAVGPEGGDRTPDPPTVSESPGATEIDIYETAYHEEVERIRSRTQDAKLYLTRRVEKPDEDSRAPRLVGLVKAHDLDSPKLAQMMDKIKGIGQHEKERAEKQVEEVSDEMQTKLGSSKAE